MRISGRGLVGRSRDRIDDGSVVTNPNDVAFVITRFPNPFSREQTIPPAEMLHPRATPSAPDGGVELLVQIENETERSGRIQPGELAGCQPHVAEGGNFDSFKSPLGRISQRVDNETCFLTKDPTSSRHNKSEGGLLSRISLYPVGAGRGLSADIVPSLEVRCAEASLNAERPAKGRRVN